MENKIITELKKQRKMLQDELNTIELKISRAQTDYLKERLNQKRNQLKAINKDYIDIFGSNPALRQKLFTFLEDLPAYALSHGLVIKLNNINIFYIWQVVIRTELYYQQEEKLGVVYTGKLKKDIENMGLFLGMKLY